MNHSGPQNRQSCVESVNLRKYPELGTTPQNFAKWTTWTKLVLGYPADFRLGMHKVRCLKYTYRSIVLLTSDVPLISKQKLKKCPKLGPLIIYLTIDGHTIHNGNTRQSTTITSKFTDTSAVSVTFGFSQGPHSTQANVTTLSIMGYSIWCPYLATDEQFVRGGFNFHLSRG